MSSRLRADGASRGRAGTLGAGTRGPRSHRPVPIYRCNCLFTQNGNIMVSLRNLQRMRCVMVFLGVCLLLAVLPAGALAGSPLWAHSVPSEITGLSLTPDGSYVLTGGERLCFLAGNGTPLWQEGTAGLTACSADGRLIAGRPVRYFRFLPSSAPRMPAASGLGFVSGLKTAQPSQSRTALTDKLCDPKAASPTQANTRTDTTSANACPGILLTSLPQAISTDIFKILLNFHQFVIICTLCHLVHIHAGHTKLSSRQTFQEAPLCLMPQTCRETSA